ALGGGQLVQPDLPRRNPGPVAGGESVLGVRPPVAHVLEDHAVPIARGSNTVGPIICWTLLPLDSSAQVIGRNPALDHPGRMKWWFPAIHRPGHARITLGIRGSRVPNRR